MEKNIINDDFYKQLDKDEIEICDLCRDWNLGDCENCEFVSRFSYKNDRQEEQVIDCKEEKRHRG